MSLEVSVAPPSALPADLVAIGVPVLAGAAGPELPSDLLAAVGGTKTPRSLDPAWCTRQGFAARPGQSLVLRDLAGGPVVVLVGLGSAEAGAPDTERWRRAGAALVRQAGEGGTAAVIIPGGAADEPSGAVASALAEGAGLAAYRFTGYRSSPAPGPIDRLVLVPAGGNGQSLAVLAGGAARGSRIAAAVTSARDLINAPPSDLTPDHLARRATELLSGAAGTTVEVWDEERIADEGMGGLLGVSRGSVQPPRFIRADYEPAHPARVDGKVPHVVLVGKGITFDSGGLSLKTANGMVTMKTDMSGAACVLTTLAACSDLDVPVRVTAMAPVTENMPGGGAIKPGDVLTARGGATIEVLNTDAEGRLVLADALALATELGPDAIIDVATLTGSVTTALGPSVAGLFGNRPELTERVRRAGSRAGEQMWILPMPEEYREHLDSDVADMKNTGRPGQAGAIVAAMLLSRFVGDVPWAHLDIAGTGRSSESTGYLSKGGTGFGVRTLVEFLGTYGLDDA